MRGGFGGVVAVPAWARFMRAATAADKPDWYEMPGDVEKVAICRLSGARATEACRHQADVYSVTNADGSPQLVPVDALADPDDVTPARTLTPGQPAVYEDLFAIGAVPSELCPLHNPPGAYGIAAVSSQGTTPTVDALVAAPTGTSGRIVPASSDIVLERVLGADGIMRVVMHQKR